VALSVLLASVLALGGVYNLARQEAAARLTAFRDILLEDLTTRFVVGDLVVESAVAQAATAETEEAAREGLYRLAGANTEYFDVILLADANGNVVSAWPPAAAPRDVSDEEYFQAALPGEERVTLRVPVEGELDVGRVWIAEAVPDEDGGVVAARLRVGFVGLLVDEIASQEDERSALVVAAQGRIVESGVGGAPFRVEDMVFSASEDEPGTGEVALDHPTLGEFAGFYSDVEAAEGLGWRVVVVEPAAVALERTQDALLPASLTVLAAVLVATGVAFLFGRRLAEPLKLLERRAREVASGAYIRPIEIDREDEVGRLAVAFNAMATRLNALQDLSQLLASASELDQVLDSILSAMEHILGTGRAAIFLIEDDDRYLELVKASGARVRDPEMSVPVAGASWVSQAFRTGRSVSFVMSPEDAAADPVVGLFATEVASSGLAVPLAIGHHPFGVILVVIAGRRRFSEAETEMARAFSAQAAIAVQNSRLFKEEHESRTEAEALRDMAELLAGPTGLEATLEQVGSIAASLLDMTDSRLVMSPRNRRDLEIGPSSEPVIDEHYASIWADVAASHPERHPADPMPVQGLRHDPLFSDLSTERDVHALILIPMMQGDLERGVLILESDDPDRAFGRRDAEVAHSVAQTISVALETNYLFQQARRRAENLEMVFRISQAVSLSLQSSVVLNRVLDVVQKMIPSTGLSLMQFDERRGVLETAMVRGVEDKRVLLAELEPGEDIPGQVFETRQPVVVHDTLRLDTPLARLLLAQGFRSWLCTPLLARGRSIGVLSVFALDPDAFSEEEAELVGTFASQAALALDTAALFEEEHKVASVLQSSIVPDTLPEIPWLETSSTYQPAGSESDIGGDYYDLFYAPDGRLVLAIGDVCGKGVQAATKTSVIKYTLRGLVGAGLGPSTALRELNTVVSETGDIADIVTMWIGYLDPKSGDLNYANAGHPPALVRTSEGEILELGPTGPLLGGIRSASFSRRTVGLDPGAAILLYTDGVTEARGPRGLFGDGRLKEVFGRGGRAGEITERVIRAVRAHAEGILRDDVAMLVARYRPDWIDTAEPGADAGARAAGEPG
jgi:serine phosphatase RsbU (regulator of sigma subunit)/HAMP domain-containing protein